MEEDEETTTTYTDYIVFTLFKTGFVSWDSFFYINTFNMEGGVEIKGYYPSALKDTLTDLDELIYAEFDDDDNIRYFTIAPYWNMDGKGGWGTDFPATWLSRV